MSEHPLWERVRGMYEQLDAECPEGYRTITEVHLRDGFVYRIGHVTPYGPHVPFFLFKVATDPPAQSALFVHEDLVVAVEVRLEEASTKKPIGFTVDPIHH